MEEEGAAVREGEVESADAVASALPQVSPGSPGVSLHSIPAPNDVVRAPRTIRVLSPDGLTVDYVSLDYYCRRVLPAEWIPAWASYSGGDQALNAGAVAIRTYAIGAINKPTSASYDICGTTACQVYGPTTSTYTDAAVSETADYLLTDQTSAIPPALTEYSAENNSLGSSCGDGFASPAGSCLSDPVCAGSLGMGMDAACASGVRLDGPRVLNSRVIPLATMRRPTGSRARTGFGSWSIIILRSV